MLRTAQFGPVTRIDSARSAFGRGFYWTTCYHVDGLLVDSGCAHTAADLVRLARPWPLAQIVNTHTHEDHIGANGLLQQQRPGLQVLAHPLALAVLADPRQAQPLQAYRRLFWGWPAPSQGQALADGAVVETARHRFQVLHTPGHSPDHLCLYEAAQGWLFTGDLFVGGRDRALRVDCAIWAIIASLKRVAALPLQTLFPGSARVRQQPGPALHEKIAYLEETGAQVLDLHRQGLPGAEIARRLFGPPLWIEAVTGGHFTRLGLVNSYLAGA